MSAALRQGPSVSEAQPRSRATGASPPSKRLDKKAASAKWAAPLEEADLLQAVAPEEFNIWTPREPREESTFLDWEACPCDNNSSADDVTSTAAVTVSDCCGKERLAEVIAQQDAVIESLLSRCKMLEMQAAAQHRKLTETEKANKEAHELRLKLQAELTALETSSDCRGEIKSDLQDLYTKLKAELDGLRASHCPRELCISPVLLGAKRKTVGCKAKRAPGSAVAAPPSSCGSLNSCTPPHSYTAPRPQHAKLDSGARPNSVRGGVSARHRQLQQMLANLPVGISQHRSSSSDLRQKMSHSQLHSLPQASPARSCSSELRRTPVKAPRGAKGLPSPSPEQPRQRPEQASSGACGGTGGTPSARSLSPPLAVLRSNGNVLGQQNAGTPGRCSVSPALPRSQHCATSPKSLSHIASTSLGATPARDATAPLMAAGLGQRPWAGRPPGLENGKPGWAYCQGRVLCS